MDARRLYRSLISGLEAAPGKVDLLKTVLAEDISIARKRKLYSQVEWTDAQQDAFDSFWLDAYGKKIPNWWHKLYQASSGVFRVDYIPEKLYTTKIEPILNDRKYAQVLQDKSLVETMAQDADCLVPKTILVRSNGVYFDAQRNPITSQTAVQLLANVGEAVIKSTYGSSSGNGVCFWQATSCDCASLEAQSLLHSTKEDIIVQERIYQHKSLARFNESSINTLRITTYVIDGEVCHVPVALRIGRAGQSVDNIHAGGIGVGVEDNGRLLEKAYSLGFGDKTLSMNKHPDSGAVFEGAIIPSMGKVLSVARHLQGRFPRVGIISWDFAVDENEDVVLIEANTLGQGLWFPQMIHGKGLFGEQTKTILSRIDRGSHAHRI